MLPLYSGMRRQKGIFRCWKVICKQSQHRKSRLQLAISFHLLQSEQASPMQYWWKTHQQVSKHWPTIVQGLTRWNKDKPPCYQGLAAAAFAYQKASALAMGHPETLYTSHRLHALLTSPHFVLHQARKTGYEVILSARELNIQRCTTIKPVTKMMALHIIV